MDFKEVNNLGDIDLWNSFVDGNEAAYGEIYSRYFSDLYYYGFKFSSDIDFIKDAIHDLFIDLRKYRKNIKVNGENHQNNPLKPYLLKSFRNKILKKNSRKKNLFDNLSPQNENDYGFQPSYEASLVNFQNSQEQSDHLKKAFQKLTRKQKEAIHLRFFEETSYEEIAKIMDFESVKSVRNLIYKALNQLRNNIPFNILMFFAISNISLLI